MRRGCIALVLACLVAAPAGAAPGKSEEEKAAMSLYNKGRARFDAGDWGAAEDLFAKSMAVYETPYARLYRSAALSRLARCGDALDLLSGFQPEQVAQKARDKAREMATEVRERCLAPAAPARDARAEAPARDAPPGTPGRDAPAAAPAPAAKEAAPTAPAAGSAPTPPAAEASPAPEAPPAAPAATAAASAPFAAPPPVEAATPAPADAPKAHARATEAARPGRAEASRAPQADRPVVVSPDGKGDFTRLEDALAKAPPGATLHLDAGLHRLSRPLVVKAAVRLVGEGRGASVVVGDGEGFVLRFEGPGPFVLHDLAVEHQGSRWARVVSVAGGEVDFRGIKVSGGVRDTAARAGGEGLLLESETTGTVVGSEFTGNALHGIKLAGRARPVLEGNACRGNGQVGIAWFDDAGGVARGNTTASNGRYGMSVVDRARPRLEGNACQDDRRGGLYLEGDLDLPRNNRCPPYAPQVP